MQHEGLYHQCFEKVAGHCCPCVAHKFIHTPRQPRAFQIHRVTINADSSRAVASLASWPYTTCPTLDTASNEVQTMLPPRCGDGTRQGMRHA